MKTQTEKLKESLRNLIHEVLCEEDDQPKQFFYRKSLDSKNKLRVEVLDSEENVIFRAFSLADLPKQMNYNKNQLDGLKKYLISQGKMKEIDELVPEF